MTIPLALTEVPGVTNSLIPMLISVLCLILILLPILLILIIVFYKKKCQHQQIMAAMEKGLPVSDLIVRPNNKESSWITHLSIGIGFLFIGIVLGGYLWWSDQIANRHEEPIYTYASIAIAGLGLIFLIMGILRRGISWMWGLSIGIGFLCAGLALYGLWLWTHNSGVTNLPTEFMIIPIVVGSLGLIFLFWGIYQKNFNKRQEILAAMEKGLPVADWLEKPRSKEGNWIRSLSSGIAFLFVGLALTVMWFWVKETPGVPSMPPFVLVVVIFLAGIGLLLLVKGILQKMNEKAASEK